MNLKQKLTYLNKREKMTQGEIARLCKTSQPTISALIAGKRKSTSFEIGQAISSLYERRKAE